MKTQKRFPLPPWFQSIATARIIGSSLLLTFKKRLRIDFLAAWPFPLSCLEKASRMGLNTLAVETGGGVTLTASIDRLLRDCLLPKWRGKNFPAFLPEEFFERGRTL